MEEFKFLKKDCFELDSESVEQSGQLKLGFVYRHSQILYLDHQ